MISVVIQTTGDPDALLTSLGALGGNPGLGQEHAKPDDLIAKRVGVDADQILVFQSLSRWVLAQVEPVIAIIRGRALFFKRAW